MVVRASVSFAFFLGPGSTDGGVKLPGMLDLGCAAEISAPEQIAGDGGAGDAAKHEEEGKTKNQDAVAGAGNVLGLPWGQ